MPHDSLYKKIRKTHQKTRYFLHISKKNSTFAGYYLFKIIGNTHKQHNEI